jgi:hypothetical protein
MANQNYTPRAKCRLAEIKGGGECGCDCAIELRKPMKLAHPSTDCKNGAGRLTDISDYSASAMTDSAARPLHS